VRGALGDDPHAPRYIAGIRGRGYRLVAPVQPLPERHREAPPTPYWIDENRVATAAALPPDPSPSPVPAPPGDLAPPRSPSAFGWIGAVIAVLVLLAVPWAITHLARTPKAADAQRTADSVVVQPPRTIAVLPLTDLSPGGGNSYLGDGLSQVLSARLARIRGLRVAARTSVSSFKEGGMDARTIAERLGVRHILEGSVQREGDRLRVTAQLIDAGTGYNVWSQTYNRKWQDLLAIEDDLARSIISALKVVLTDESTQRTTPPSANHLAAFDLYLAGLAKLHNPAVSQLEAAGDDFNQALEKEPTFALAYVGLCERYVFGYERTRDAALVPKAEGACGKALQLDRSLTEASTALAQLYLVSGRNEQAAQIYREGIRNEPDNADGYMGLGEALDGMQRTAEAERAFRQAIEAEPTFPEALTTLGNFLFRHGRSATAVATYEQVTQLIPASPLAFNNLGAALEMTADFHGAATAFERSLALEPSRSAYSNLGTVYYFLGRYADAAHMFSRSTELAAEDHRVWGNLADALWQIPASRSEAQGDYRHAIALAQRSLEVNPKEAVTAMQLAYYCARIGDLEHANRYAGRALALDASDPYVHYYAALIALERGDTTAAIDSLHRAIELGYPAQLVSAAPDFMNLRSDARFRRLLTPPSKSPEA
jgi:TolB-like protein/Flp pilus assembly protein TadD